MTEQLSLFCFMRRIFNCVALHGSHLYARESVIQLPSFHRPKALTPAPPLHPNHLCVSLEIRAPPLKQLVTLLLASSVDSPAYCQDSGFPILSDKLIHPFLNLMYLLLYFSKGSWCLWDSFRMSSLEKSA